MHIDRRFRLPSYRALQEQRRTEVAISEAIAAFNGKVDSHITEADCRKKPAENKQEEATGPADDGWIKHDGKGMPVDGLTLVLVRLRNGAQITPDSADFWHGPKLESSNWVHDGGPVDIVAYRVISEPAAEKPKADANGWIENTKTTPGCPPELVGKQLELRFAGNDRPQIWRGGIHCTAWDRRIDHRMSAVITHYRVLPG